MTTFLRYMLIREACRGQPVVLFAFDNWFVFTPSSTVFRFDGKKRVPDFGNKLFNGVVCLVDPLESEGWNLGPIFVRANMRFVQVVALEYENQFSCRDACITVQCQFEGPKMDEKNKM